MIEVFTLGKPGKILTRFSEQIFALPEGAYNLPDSRSPYQELFKEIYVYGVRQIIVDNKGPEEIRFMDGHEFAKKMGSGQPPEHDAIMIIKKPA